jgi:hypothetical protein
MRIPMIERSTLDPELQVMLEKWEAEGGDPNFILTFARLPERQHAGAARARETGG